MDIEKLSIPRVDRSHCDKTATSIAEFLLGNFEIYIEIGFSRDLWTLGSW